MATALASSMASLSLCSTSRRHSCRPTPSFGFSCSMRGQAMQITGAFIDPEACRKGLGCNLCKLAYGCPGFPA